MPLKGKNSQTGETALTFEAFDTLKAWRKQGVLVCPFCDGPMVAVREYSRMGSKWVADYLRHDGDCNTTYKYHEQSPEHYAAKRDICEMAETLHGIGAVAECEVAMPEIGRIADVCITLPDGERVVHEAQLAAIGIDELEERTNDYQRGGYGIVWHFGKAANTATNREWARRRLGGCEILIFEERTITV